jgi:hypothetical protein
MTMSQILRAATDLDALEDQGQAPAGAFEILRGRAGSYDPVVLSGLGDLLAAPSNQKVVREVTLAQIRPGMVFAEDVKLIAGTLLVARGYEVTPTFIERMRHFRPGSLREPLRIVLGTDRTLPTLA